MTICFLNPEVLVKIRDAINTDAEFGIAAKTLTNDVLLEAGDARSIIKVREGVVTEIMVNPTYMEAWQFGIKASTDAWEKFLQPVPPPFYNALFPAMIRQIFHVDGDLEKAFAHFWPITRMLDILRDLQNK